MTLGDELVLQVLDDIAALAVKLEDPTTFGHQLHGLADVVVIAHPGRPLLVGHEHLVRLDAHVQRLREPLQDVGAVLKDEVEPEVHHRRVLDLLPGAVDGVREGLLGVEIIHPEPE